MRVVITGGGTGIGFGAAQKFVDQGDDVVLVGRREHVLDQAVSALGPMATALVADVTVPSDVRRMADHLHDGLDALVCAAGGVSAITGDDLGAIAARWQETYRANVISAVLPTEVLLPLLTQPGGRVVVVSSVSGRKGSGSYGAAKAALNNWVVDLAGELAGRGITVNAVAPGYVPDTGFWDGRRDADEVARRVAKVAMGRAGTPAEVAAAIAYFASAESGFTTGQILGIDGGTLLAL